jgi:hypothetical protein
MAILPWAMPSSTVVILSLMFMSQCLTSSAEYHPFQHHLGNLEPLLVQTSHMKILQDVCTWYFSSAQFIVVIPLDSKRTSDFTEELLPLIHDKINMMTIVSWIDVPKDFNISSGRLWKNLSILHQAFIFIVERGDTLLQFLRFIQHSNVYPHLRNPRGHFLIIFTGTPGNGQNEVTALAIENKHYLLLQTLWKELGILNMILMLIRNSDYSQPKSGHPALMAMFNPFINSTHSREKLVLHKANHVTNLVRSYTGILNNLRGYPVRITLFPRKPTSFPLHSGDEVIDYIGVDGFFTRNLAKQMNFTAIARGPEDGNEYGFMFQNNGSFTGSIGDILYDRADISLNSRFVKLYGTNDIEFTLPVGFDSLCIVVPKAKRFPKWLALFRVFNLHVQFALVCAYVGCSIISHILQIMHSHFKHVHENMSLFDTFIEVLPPFLSLPVMRMPSSMHQKVFVMTCFVSGMITASLFQGKLVNVLSKPDYYPDINTLEELDASGLVIGTASRNLVVDTFSTEESSLMKHLWSKITYYNLQDGVISYALKHHNIASLTRLSNAIYSVQLHHSSDGTLKLHIVKECPRIYALAYIVPKGSPFLLRINHIIEQFIESGIIDKWNEDTHFYMTAFKKSEYCSNDSLKVFTLEDLQMPFLILACGLFGSVIIFFMELTTQCVARCKVNKCWKESIWPAQNQTQTQVPHA